MPRYSTPCRGVRPGHKAWPHQKIATATAPAFPCLSHAFFPGAAEEIYNQDFSILIYLKKNIFFTFICCLKNIILYKNTILVPIKYDRLSGSMYLNQILIRINQGGLVRRRHFPLNASLGPEATYDRLTAQELFSCGRLSLPILNQPPRIIN